MTGAENVAQPFFVSVPLRDESSKLLPSRAVIQRFSPKDELQCVQANLLALVR
jgi:hypothetical protein